MRTFLLTSLDRAVRSLSQGFPITGLCFLLTAGYTFCQCVIRWLSIFFLKHNSDHVILLLRIQKWLPLADRTRSPSLHLHVKLTMIQIQPAFPASSHYITPDPTQGFSNLCVSESPGGFVKTHISGPPAQHSWFRECEMGPWNSAFLTRSQVMLMLCLWGLHFRKHCCNHTKT